MAPSVRPPSCDKRHVLAVALMLCCAVLCCAVLCVWFSQLEAKDYELRRSRGQLATASAAGARATNLQAVPHSYSADGCLRYGDTIQLAVTEENSKGVDETHTLANDIFNVVDIANKTVAASASREKKALARNTFVITRAPAKTHYEVGCRGVLCAVASALSLIASPSLPVEVRQ